MRLLFFELYNYSHYTLQATTVSKIKKFRGKPSDDSSAWNILNIEMQARLTGEIFYKRFHMHRLVQNSTFGPFSTA